MAEALRKKQRKRQQEGLDKNKILWYNNTINHLRRCCYEKEKF